MSTDLTTLKQQQPATRRNPDSFPAILEASLKEIGRALPKHINADRMARIALTEFKRNPDLRKCSPVSILASVVQASQLGLEIGVRGRAYLVPYKGECTFIPGWKGLVDLCNRTGRATVWTGAVFEGDEFEYALGDTPYIKHKPAGESDPERLLYTYAVGRVNGATVPVIEVWPVAKLRRHRDRYNKVGKSHYSFANFEAYCRKIPLLRVLDFMPASVELEQALQMSYAADVGGAHVTVRDAIDGTWTPAPQQDEPPAQIEHKDEPEQPQQTRQEAQPAATGDMAFE